LTSASSLGRLAAWAAVLVPFALVVGLALRGGGFDLSPRGELELGTRHVAGLLAWALVILMLVAGVGSTLRLRRPILVPVVLIGSLALLCAISSLWSGSAERSFNEANRVLAYWAFFAAAFLITQTGRRRQCFAYGLTAAISAIVVLALTSRLLPGVLTVQDDGVSRLSYPLIYFNATGVVVGMGIVLLTWMTRWGSRDAIRFGAFALLPPSILTLYFTYSRGGVAAALIGSGVLIALSRHRLLYTARLAIALLCVAPVILAVQGSGALAGGVRDQSAQDQGLVVLGLLILATTIAVAGSWILEQIRLEARAGSRRALTISRDRRVLTAIGALMGIALVALAVALGDRAWNRFSDTELIQTSPPEARLIQLNGTGRSDFWRVAIDGFEQKPLLGQGAGTFQFSWRENRSITNDVRDAHSLYIETLSELGLLGGLLVIGLIGSFLWWGFAAWRKATEAEQERCAVFVAVLVACAVTFGFDWFWEMPVVGAILFLTAGALMNVSCEQLQAPADGRRTVDGDGRYAFGVAGLAVAWVSMASLLAPLWTQRELRASQDAAASGDMPTAVRLAETARQIEPWAASPYVQLGLLAEAQGDDNAAVGRLDQAIHRENRNWQLYKLRAEAETRLGLSAAAAGDFRQAQHLNPIAYAEENPAGVAQ